jgi:hypothetical protein
MKRYTLLPLVLLTSIALADELWTINSQADWEQHSAAQTNLEIKEGMVAPTAKTASFRSKLKRFNYDWGWTLESGYLHDYPERHKPLGVPKNAYQRTKPDGWEFTREFEHASVWVDTEKREAKITWQ